MCTINGFGSFGWEPCQALQEARSIQLAEVPLAPKEPQRPVSLRLTTDARTLEILDADPAVLDGVLRMMFHTTTMELVDKRPNPCSIVGC